MKILVTGGAGFIGSALCEYIIQHTPHQLLVVDSLSYAGQISSLATIKDDPRFQFERKDICDAAAMSQLLQTFKPDGLIHLAAETHVDRMIDEPEACIRTNISGTFTLLQTCHKWLSEADNQTCGSFRFLHVSTDEVYGDLGPDGEPFDENSPYRPSTPYSATKASSDHLVRTWHKTYGIPALITHGSNTYGPRQYPEKLIPLMITRALASKNLPVYGDGSQVRDWLYVEDHARALYEVLLNGRPGHSYNIAGGAEKRNLDVVSTICQILDEHATRSRPKPDSYAELISFVKDRPAHDTRYAMNTRKVQQELGWHPETNFEDGLRQTVLWYLSHPDWWESILQNSDANERRGLLNK